MRAKRLVPRLSIAAPRAKFTKRSDSQRVRAAWLTRAQPATVTLRFAADHIAALGQARDELERKA